MNEPFVFFAMTVPLSALAVVLFLYDRIRRREALYRWACEQKVNLRSAQQSLLTEANALPASLSKSMHVFRIHLETKDGNRRTGWVRLVNALPGLGSTQADVKWDSA